MRVELVLFVACAAGWTFWPSDARAQVNTETLRKRIKSAGYSMIVEESITGDWATRRASRSARASAAAGRKTRT